MRTQNLLLLAGLVGFGWPLYSQSVPSDNKQISHIDSVVHRAATAYMRRANTKGLSIGIRYAGQNFTYNYGTVKEGVHQLPTANTFYNMGSVAKTFVGVLLAQTIIDKKAKLEDDIRTYLPNTYPNLVYRSFPVRFVHLANHTSALPKSAKSYPTSIRDSLARLDLSSQVNFYSRYNQDSLLRDMHSFEVDTIPGTTYSYNSSAMMVLVLLLERIYHQPYERLVAAYLQSHLNMHNTKVQLSDDDIRQVAQGFDAAGHPRSYANLRGFYIGPSMNSTVNDMLKYIDANLTEQDPSLGLSHQPTWRGSGGFGIGLGWMLDNETETRRRIYHSGNTKIGYNTLCSLYPHKQIGVIIFVNETISQDAVGELEKAIVQGLN